MHLQLGKFPTVVSIDWAMLETMRNLERIRKAQAEARKVFNEKQRVDEEELVQLKFLEMVIKETPRLHPSAAFAAEGEPREV
ncbi:hypothetical protein MLD38_000913 [Melastoma candidum]|uniref:Uncharacterized protein n=1 Tax=Melastoma candidum TaxID=119954 RepID=A0ACB9SC10_9MYRT|nr:hypothetical protein MLD38_000913 [Melastoma candidum]